MSNVLKQARAVYLAKIDQTQVADAQSTSVPPAAHKVLRNIAADLHPGANLKPRQNQHIGSILEALRRRALIDTEQRLTPLARVYLSFYEN